MYFWGANNTLVVIIAKDLLDMQVEALILVLQRFKRAIGWIIADIIRILPTICTQKIKLQLECVPSIEHPHHLNPPIKEMVKKKLIKWLDISVVTLFLIACG